MSELKSVLCCFTGMKKQNRLEKASSPYLQQHAGNPVDWYEWGEEALQRAKAENKPLIISIGYAACHWCHVMAHESFEDEEIALFMNANFVCIKVDREERPDIDQIYMDAARITSGRGGWPLNAVALPDGRPFFAATYFPPKQWINVLEQLQKVFINEPERVIKAATSITGGINTNPFSEIEPEQPFTKDDYHKAFENHIRSIDFESGGYRNAPKFMLPVGFEYFLQYYYLTRDDRALKAVTTTLDAMAMGGLYDQIGGGFARYSTDEHWLVPHFEKMLYDNAQLISLYSQAYQLTNKSFYKEIIQKTIAFAERELLDTSGGFYSSLDADSEHQEGKFYVFTKSEIENVLESGVAEIIADFYHISEKGNWEEGKNILHNTVDKAAFASGYHLSVDDFQVLLQNANNQLFEYRSKRVRPGTDDKILCSWNALMISAYIDAYKATGMTEYLESALKTGNFTEKYLMQSDGSLLRVYKNGKSSVNAFLDDYALLAKAFIDLYQVTFDISWLEKSKLLTKYVIAGFLNETGDMFYYTPTNNGHLFARKYETSDNVIPASNSVMAHVLYQLSYFYDIEGWKKISEKMLSKVIAEVTEDGVYYSNWAQLLGQMVYKYSELIVTGENVFADLKFMQKIYLPLTIFAGGKTENLPLLKNKYTGSKTVYYLCIGNTCTLPETDGEKLIETIHHIND